jgi:hypothetical protein
MCIKNGRTATPPRENMIHAKESTATQAEHVVVATDGERCRPTTTSTTHP